MMPAVLFILFFLSFCSVKSQQIITPVWDPTVVTSSDSVSLIVSQTGYAYPGVRHALLCSMSRDSGDKITEYKVIDTIGNIVGQGHPIYWGKWAGNHFWYIDLNFLVQGKYYLIAKSLRSHFFKVENVADHYIKTLSRDMFTIQLDKRRKNDAKGGYVDCGTDIRETGSHATMVLGICNILKSKYGNFTDADRSHIMNHLEHFGDFFMMRIDSVGKIDGGYWQEWKLKHLGVIPGQLMAIQALMEIYSAFKLYDEGIGAKYYKTALHSLKNMRSNYSIDTLHSALLCLWLQAEVVFYRESVDSTSWRIVNEIAAELGKRQITKEERSQNGIYGTFYEYAHSKNILRLNYHGKGYDFYGVYWGNHIKGFLDLIALQPTHDSVHIWKKIVHDYYNGFLANVVKRNPFGLIANGEYYGIRWFSDLFHGISVTYSKVAEQCIRYGIVMNDSTALSVAEQQLLWIAGFNTGVGYPYSSNPVSCIVGKGYQWIRDGYGEFPDITGSIVNGFSATQQFKQEIPQNGDVPRFIGNESYIAHTGAWLTAVAALSDVRPSVYTNLDKSTDEQNGIVTISPNPCYDYIAVTSIKQWVYCAVYSLSGERVFLFNEPIIPNISYRFDISLSDNRILDSGNYFLCLYDSSENLCIPFTVNR